MHQEGLTINEKILRYFDLSSQYGVSVSPTFFGALAPCTKPEANPLTAQKPCIGIARMKRWKRADALSLKPPIEVLAVLLKEQARQSKDADRAYLDDLLSSRIGVD